MYGMGWCLGCVCLSGYLFVVVVVVLPRRMIDFPQGGCSRDSFLLLNLFYGGHWKHLISDINKEGEKHLKRILGEISPLQCEQEPKESWITHLLMSPISPFYDVKSGYLATELNRTKFPFVSMKRAWVSNPSKTGHKETPSFPEILLKNQYPNMIYKDKEADTVGKCSISSQSALLVVFFPFPSFSEHTR